MSIFSVMDMIEMRVVVKLVSLLLVVKVLVSLMSLVVLGMSS